MLGPESGGFDAFAAVLAVAAFVVLRRFAIQTYWLVPVDALVGMVVALVGAAVGGSMVTVQQVLVSAVVGLVVSLAVLVVDARVGRRAPADVLEIMVLSLLVALSILAWRLGANVPELNDDPIPVVSPNDLLCPVITYVLLSVYAGFRDRTDVTGVRRERALLTLVSLLVNVLTI